MALVQWCSGFVFVFLPLPSLGSKVAKVDPDQLAFT